MATLGTGKYTLIDQATRTDESGKTQHIVELLSETNDILRDMFWKEGNLASGERVTIRTGLPIVCWRNLNSHTPSSSSQTAQIEVACKQIDHWQQEDADLMELGGDVKAARMSESAAGFEAVGQAQATNIFYGNTDTDPTKYSGLNVSYGSLSAENARNVISGGGSGSDNSSIYAITWGPRKIYGIFPKGSKAGLQHTDLGKVVSETSSGNMEVYKERFKWDAGLVIADWRYAVRICNIDFSALTPDASAGANLIELMMDAKTKLKNVISGSTYFYMNSDLQSFLDRQAQAGVSAGGGLTYQNVAGKQMTMFAGIPVRRCDAITNTEATVS